MKRTLMIVLLLAFVIPARGFFGRSGAAEVGNGFVQSKMNAVSHHLAAS